MAGAVHAVESVTHATETPMAMAEPIQSKQPEASASAPAVAATPEASAPPAGNNLQYYSSHSCFSMS